MKTPREILLERHQTIDPKLDGIRTKVLNSELRAGTPQAWLSGWLAAPWRELVWPYRRIWAGLAAVWLAIFAVNLSMDDHSPTVATKTPEPSPELILAFWRQEQLLAELTEPRPLRAVLPQRSIFPKPRSERRAELLLA